MARKASSDQDDSREKKAAQDDEESLETDITTVGYKWGGNTTYDKPLEIGITDDDSKQDWFGKETGDKAELTINGENSHTINGGGTIKTSFMDKDGEQHTENILFINSAAGWIMVPSEDSAFEPGSKIIKLHNWEEMGDVDYDDYDNDETICFTPSCMILTPFGELPAALISAGDMVVTADNGVQTVRWVGRSRVCAHRRSHKNLHPVLIRAHTYGHGYPHHDLRVSPQHRFCLTGAEVELNFAYHQAMAPAIGLIDGKQIIRDQQAAPVTYIHLLFDRHEVVFANALACESFHPDPRIVSKLGRSTRDELLQLFPELTNKSKPMLTARPCLKHKQTKAIRKPFPLLL